MTIWRITYASPQVSVPVTQSVGTTHAPDVRDATRVHRWRLVVALLLAVMLAGCTSTSERSLSFGKRTQITERHPTPDGGYVEKVTEYTEGEKSTETTTKADVDWAGAVSKGVGQAVTSDWLGLGITAGTMLAAGGAAVVSERKRRLRAEANEDEVYNDLKSMKEMRDAG
jgi:hypothetical protein